MWLHAELSHHRCGRAPQIVRCPMRQRFARCLRDPLVESFPTFSPAGERTIAKTENELSCFAVGICTSRLRVDYCAGRFGKRDNVASAVLGSLSWQHDHAVV